MTRILPALTLCLALGGPGPAPGAAAQRPQDNLILITLDGARVEEIFGGLDLDVLRSTLRDRQRPEDQRVYRQYWADTPAARRETMMPFFWRTLMARHGSIAGNPRLNSSVTLANRHRISYPGYAEILLGEAHDAAIKSNDPIQNPYVTVLEELRRRLALPSSGAAVFGSWNVFTAIAEHVKGSLTINAGFDPFPPSDLSRMQFETPTPWNSVRHDAYTFRFALDHLRLARPRVLYLALGETDDWAHDGRYDRVLETYARTDRWLEELWTWLQATPGYRDRTHILITTDHGRGRGVKDWRNHGADVEGAQDVWVALISPTLRQRGEWRDHPALRTSQIAATLAGWMGLDWRALRPSAGPPIQ